MRTVTEFAQPGSVAATTVLLLPAAYTGPEDFLRAGFDRAVRERALQVDLVFADLNLQHLTDRTLLRRMRHELVLPARALGSQCIWICGISLGGFIGLAYAERFAGEVDGLCLLAPYLGNHMVTGEIRRAGGLAVWEPADIAEDDDERRLWRFIKSHGQSRISIHLGYGKDDRFAASHQMMAAVLEPQNVTVVPGGHDWAAWSRLWEHFLDRVLLQGNRQGHAKASR